MAKQMVYGDQTRRSILAYKRVSSRAARWALNDGRIETDL